MVLFVRRWLRARITLGWALFKHLLTGPFAPRRSAPGPWLQRIGAEGLGPTPAANWGHLEGSSKCIGCGLCDMFGSAALPRPSLMIQGAARLPSDAPHIAEAELTALLAIAQDVARVCPQGVLVTDICALIRNNQAALVRAQVGTV